MNQSTTGQPPSNHARPLTTHNSAGASTFYDDDRPAAGFVHPLLGSADQITNYSASGNDEQVTGTTIALMARLVREDASAENVRKAAADAVSVLPANADDVAVFNAVWRWVKDHVSYVGESRLIEPFDFFFPPDELLVRPALLLAMGKPEDDCDGFSMVILAMLRSLGYQRLSFATIAANEAAPHLYSHVYAIAFDRRGRQYPLDASHGPAPGVEYSRNVTKRRLWPVGGSAQMITRQQQQRRPALGAIDWGAITAGATDIAKGVLIPRYGNPPAGTTRMNTADGASSISTFPGGGFSLAGGGMSGNTMLIVAAVAVVGIALVSRR